MMITMINLSTFGFLVYKMKSILTKMKWVNIYQRS